MGYGARDAVDTPSLGLTDLRAGAAPLLAKIATLGRLIGDQTSRRGVGKHGRDSRSPEQALVTIGASAGGPAALSAVLTALPRSFPPAIVVVQHVDERFLDGMAEWLDQHSALPVRLAREGDRPIPGMVLLAGTGNHLVLNAARRLDYTPEPRDFVYYPSVDVFFRAQAGSGNTKRSAYC